MWRQTQSLNGYWQYSVNETPQGSVRVPFSAHCVGDSLCELTFDAAPAPYAELCLEGVAYKARVTLNGTFLGEMVAYSRYVFDVTKLLLPVGNRLSVALVDMNIPFGPSEGWENYGGIIRDVYLTYLDEIHVRDAVWRTRAREPYREALCDVRVTVGGASACPVTAILTDARGDEVAAAEGMAQNGEAALAFTVQNPALWSPEAPNLYTLTVRAGDDEWSRRVGVKDFQIKGQRFYLNGQPIFLKGLNRHDMWGDEGYTLSRAQMEKDMRLIKSMGCNYVRLVHYPHHPYILDLADELGLMVSEEPGLWWSDMHNPEVTEGALEVMRRVILRDRNHCSVAFWLCFNECVFTPEFLEASSALCRSLDPDRPVSGANCMTKEVTKELFAKHGFDFYTRHPYTYEIGQFKQEAEYLNDLPLVFTEWGGYWVFENGLLFEDSLREMIALWRNPDGAPVLAGCAYWCWADMYEFGRGRLACNDGILNEGLVDIYRNARGNFDRYARIMRGFDVPEIPPRRMSVSQSKLCLPGARPLDVWQCARREDQDQAWARMLEDATPTKGYVHKTKRRLANGPELPQDLCEVCGVPLRPGTRRPLVVAYGAPLTIPCGEKAAKVCFMGNVSLPWGYPLYGQRGELGGKYVLHYADGSQTEIPLRNGVELTTALGQQGPSRVNPIAPGVTRAASWEFDGNWEHYVANLFVADADAAKRLEAIEVVSCHPECALLVYAVTVA